MSYGLAKQIMTESEGMIYRSTPPDAVTIPSLARFAHKKGYRRVGITHVDHFYGELVRDTFKQAFEAAGDGAKVVATAAQSEGSRNVSSSDTVSCVANLSNLTGRQRDEIRALADSAALKNSDVGTRLLHFIKAEKPYFLPKIELSDLKSVFAVRPKQTNQRILAQQGAFLIFGLRSSLRDPKEFGIEVVRTAGAQPGRAVRARYHAGVLHAEVATGIDAPTRTKQLRNRHDRRTRAQRASCAMILLQVSSQTALRGRTCPIVILVAALARWTP